ncbi:MAG: exosortase/archaeosortase family protein [Deltaproteobacteria bacterium]|nr:exosortase/archaeosortase family protein [Deltaproteobacteria bacterium]
MKFHTTEKQAALPGLEDGSRMQARRLFAQAARLLTAANIAFALITLACAFILLIQGRRLSGLLLEGELYSHISLIPLVSAYFLYTERRRIFSSTSPPLSETLPGLAAFAAGLVMYAAGVILLPFGGVSGPNDYLALLSLSAFVSWCGGFVIAFGKAAFRRAAFPVFFLLFMVPLPGFLVDALIRILQTGSTSTAEALFSLTGAPFIREGFVFRMPGMNIEVARECSGIRSTIALIITFVAAGRLCLGEGWKRAALFIAIIPVSVFKNGVRIAALSLLGIYVDERALKGPLHNYGGFLFFALGMLMLGALLWGLSRAGRKRTGA